MNDGKKILAVDSEALYTMSQIGHTFDSAGLNGEQVKALKENNPAFQAGIAELIKKYSKKV